MGTDVVSAGREGPPTLTEGVDLLAAFTRAAHARHDAEVAVVESLGALVRAGVVEALEGLPVDLLLAVEHAFTAAERAMLLDACDVLAAMPATMQLWRDRRISWSQVRGVVALARRYGREVRVALDGRIDASADLVELLDADRLEWTVAEALQEIIGPREEARVEVSEVESFASVQLDLFGRGRLYAELDARQTAILCQALDTRAAADTAADPVEGDAASGVADRSAADGAAPRPATGAPRRRRWTRSKARARALIGLLADSLAGRTADGRARPARPLLVVHVPLDRVESTAAGYLEVAANGPLPTLSARLTDALAADADVRAVLFEGARPLMVTRKLRASDIPADTRLSVAARDMGARDPGGRTPIGLSHVHHIGGNGEHDPDQMACVSPRGHLRLIHRHGWNGTIDPDDGRITWTRTGDPDRTITTLPAHTRLRRPEEGATR